MRADTRRPRAGEDLAGAPISQAAIRSARLARANRADRWRWSRETDRREDARRARRWPPAASILRAAETSLDSGRQADAAKRIPERHPAGRLAMRSARPSS